MVEQRDMFLSQKAVHAFGGYATQQLRRLQATLARDRYDQSEKEKQILSSCKSSMTSFNDRYQEFENGAIHLYVDESQREDLDTEIFLDVNLTHYPLRDYKNIWSDLNTMPIGKLSANLLAISVIRKWQRTQMHLLLFGMGKAVEQPV